MRPFVLRPINGEMYSISSFRNVWKAERRKKEMEKYNTSNLGIAKASRIQLKLSNELYNMNLSRINRDRDDILKTYGYKNIDEYFEKFSKIVIDKKYVNKYKYNDLDVYILSNEIDKEYYDIMINLQKMVTHKLFMRNIMGISFYLPCFKDNRGRQYYGTLLSPTFSKIFRNLYTFTGDVILSRLVESVYYKKIISYAYLIDCSRISMTDVYFKLLLALEIGKNFEKAKDGYMVSTEKIILTGLEKYEKREFVGELDEDMYIEKMYDQMDKLKLG